MRKLERGAATVGCIARLCDKSELIDFAKMTTLTIDRYKVFRCLGMVERRRLSSIFSRCSDFSHSLAMQRTASQPPSYVLRVCHLTFGCVARLRGLAVADLVSR